MRVTESNDFAPPRPPLVDGLGRFRRALTDRTRTSYSILAASESRNVPLAPSLGNRFLSSLAGRRPSIPHATSPLHRRSLLGLGKDSGVALNLSYADDANRHSRLIGV